MGLLLLLYSTPEEILAKSEGVCRIMAQLKHYRNPFSQMTRLCREALEYLLPLNAHIVLGNRVQVGMTHWPSFKRHTVRGSFETREKLIEALLVSAYIPGFFLSFPHPDYPNFVDGGFSHSYCKRPELSVVVTVAKYPDSDVWSDGGMFHLNLMGYEEYMGLFWKGVESAGRKHEVIVEKLRRGGMYRGE